MPAAFISVIPILSKMYKDRSAQALAKPLTGMLEDFDAFFEKLEKRKEELGRGQGPPFNIRRPGTA
jgi:hypothetical protein